MPFAVLIIVGLVFYTEVLDNNKVKEVKQESATEVTSTKSLESKPIQQQVKVIPKTPESIKEEAKIESLKEEIKILNGLKQNLFVHVQNIQKSWKVLLKVQSL